MCAVYHIVYCISSKGNEVAAKFIKQNFLGMVIHIHKKHLYSSIFDLGYVHFCCVSQVQRALVSLAHSTCFQPVLCCKPALSLSEKLGLASGARIDFFNHKLIVNDQAS